MMPIFPALAETTAAIAAPTPEAGAFLAGMEAGIEAGAEIAAKTNEKTDLKPPTEMSGNGDLNDRH